MNQSDTLIFQVDAFTDRPFHGNAAAVCLLDGPREPTWMQAVAAEMNLAETAFLWPEAQGYRLRWFTPTVEVPLCGHATLASAHILLETGKVAAGGEILFYSASGTLPVRHLDGAQNWLELNFPGMNTKPVELPETVAQGIADTPVATGTVADLANEGPCYLIEVPSESEVRSLQPNLRAWRAPNACNVLVTARAETAGIDFVSRCFFPAAGIDEDPVTGAAHCALARYWTQRLDKQEMVAYQASARGGTVRIRIDGDRIHLRGTAVTVFSGTLRV